MAPSMFSSLNLLLCDPYGSTWTRISCVADEYLPYYTLAGIDSTLSFCSLYLLDVHNFYPPLFSSFKLAVTLDQWS